MNGMQAQPSPRIALHRQVRIPTGDAELFGDLFIPANAKGIVLFAHGSGSGRHSPRNRFVAAILQNAGLGTLLFDLLTAREEEMDIRTRHLRFDIGLLSARLAATARWVGALQEAEGLKLGLFGASTGAAAALVAAAELGTMVGAVVSRGGRPDLAGIALASVEAPVLLIVGGLDREVIQLNELALDRLHCEKELRVVSGASHLFEEAGTLEIAGQMAADWFLAYLAPEDR